MSSARSRSGGIVIVMTLRRYERSSRNRPAAIIPRRSRFVAAITRTSTLSALVPPTRRYSPASRKRSSFGCSARGISPISSRNSVPLSATSTRPCLAATALVNAPFSWPKSSDSIRLSENVAQLSGMNGEAQRRLCCQSVFATSSLPVPLSPWISTGESVGATLRISARISRSCRLSPTNSSRGLLADELLLEQPVLHAELRRTRARG